jgi:hypothetical protein
MKIKSIFTLGFLMLFVGISFAAAPYFPEKINFQGYLTDSSGTALNGSYDITIKLYSAATGGTALATDTHTGVSVVNGVFTLQIGDNLTAGWSSNLGNISSAYIGVTVGSGSELTPRTLLVAVPYAFYAKNVSGESVSVNASNGIGVLGRGNQTDGVGVYGLGQRAIVGSSEGANGTAVTGTAYGTAAIGIYGYSVQSDGVRGVAVASGQSGVFGTTDSNNVYGISAVNTAATTGTHTGASLLISGKVKVNTGTNKAVGTGTITEGNSTVTIANTSVSANSLIFLTVNTSNAIASGGIRVSAITADVGFTVSTMSGDAAQASRPIPFSYLIIN